MPVFQTVKTRRRGRLWRERVSSPRTQLVKKVFLTSLQTGKQVPCRYHLLQFLLRGMGFSGAKIAPSPPYTRRFCRLSKLSKSVGLRRLENLKGFRPAAGDDYSAKGFRPPRALRWVLQRRPLLGRWISERLSLCLTPRRHASIRAAANGACLDWRRRISDLAVLCGGTLKGAARIFPWNTFCAPPFRTPYLDKICRATYTVGTQRKGVFVWCLCL